MSNYPPGVTGNEFEIAGPSWEGEIERTCEQTDVEIKVAGVDATEYADAIQAGKAGTFEGFLRSLVTITLPDCLFIDMEVPAWSYGGVLHWKCPVCGHEYEEDERE